LVVKARPPNGYDNRVNIFLGQTGLAPALVGQLVETALMVLICGNQLLAQQPL
jgi:hypothetical protein